MSAVANVLALTAIRVGHRELLATFSEFRAGLDRPSRRIDPEELRGMLAFLRNRVIPFSHQEERMLGPGGEEWESAAFDHAFLAVEIDALAREVAALLALPHGRGAEREVAASRVRRRLYRIQAVMELHVLRGEDHD